jgi:hypothetical protein
MRFAEGVALLMTKSVAAQHVKDNISATRTIRASFRRCPRPGDTAEPGPDARRPDAPIGGVDKALAAVRLDEYGPRTHKARDYRRFAPRPLSSE